jgi:hypothetical protein
MHGSGSPWVPTGEIFGNERSGVLHAGKAIPRAATAVSRRDIFPAGSPFGENGGKLALDQRAA